MSDEPLEKYIASEESDPQAIASRVDDTGFLALYRSLNPQHVDLDEEVVKGSVDNGVVPAAVRYGIMRRGKIEVIRGVVKSTQGEFFYFNWSPSVSDIHLVKADDETKQWEADKLFKGCGLGCDLRKSDAPLDPGETVEEATEDDLEKEGEEKAVPVPSAGQQPILEEQYMAQQDRLTTQHQPGSTASAMPDDKNTGRDWHGDLSRGLSRPGDGAPVATDGEHWSAVDLLKAWGQKMQATAPRLAPAVSGLEQRYMTEVMGLSPDQIHKGYGIPPRHRLGFQQWKASQLRGRLSGLERYLRG